MRVETALKRRDKIRESYRSIFSRAAHFGTPHSEMLKERRRVLETTGKGCPSWVREYSCGIWDELQNQAYARNLVHGAMIGGRFYSTHSKRPDYYGRNGIEPSEFARLTQGNPDSGHYWLLENGTVKPFFTYATDARKESTS